MMLRLSGRKMGKPLSTTKITIHKLDNSGSINFVYGNLVQFNTKIEFLS